MKRFLAAVLAITMVFGTAAVPGAFDGVLGGSAIVAEAAAYGDFEYEVLEDGTISITRYTGADTELVIPAEIDGAEVTEIEWEAFKGCTSLKSVTIPNRVSFIGSSAFLGCTSLESVNIPSAVSTINMYTFHGCTALKSIFLAADIEFIDDYALGYYTDANGDIAKLSDLKIYCYKDTPAYEYALANDIECEAQTQIFEYEKDQFNYTAIISRYNGTDSDIVIPAQINGMPVTGIGYSAFENSTLIKSVTLPDTLTTIYDRAFSGCTSLESVEFSENLEYISTEAFSGCTSLKSIKLPKEMRYISSCAFSDCTSLASVQLPDNLGGLGYAAFSNTAVVNSQTDEIKYLCGWVVDADKDIKKADIKEGTKAIASLAFDNCHLLESAILPDSVKMINFGAFVNCKSLSSISLGSGVESISEYAFYECPSLKSVTIPRSCKELDAFSFGYGDEPGTNFFGYTSRSARSGGPEIVKMSDFFIYCYSGTAGEAYAVENEIGYRLLDDVEDSITGVISLSGAQAAEGFMVTAVGADGEEYTAEISANGDFAFKNLVSGEYTITVSCKNFVSKSFDIKVGTDAVGANTSLNLIGDLNGDGKISILDIVKANAAVKETSTLDEYDSEVADVNSDGKLSIVDVVKMNAHMKGKSSLWK